MNQEENYFNFLKEKGRPLAESYDASPATALTVDDALDAVDLLEGSIIGISGGDILTEDEKGKLIYAIHFWGYEYIYLNWSCNYLKDENQEHYAERSHQVAKEKIGIAAEVANRLGKKCYIILVISLGRNESDNSKPLLDLSGISPRAVYFKFLFDYGRPLAESYDTSPEIALTADEALNAVELLKGSTTAISGGTILTEDEKGKLIYAIHFWGDEYIYLNWSCDYLKGENQEHYAERSCKAAKKSIKAAAKVAKRLGQKCYIVLVVSDKILEFHK